MKKRRVPILIFVVLALVVLVLSQCQPEPPEEFPDPEFSDGQPLPPAQERPPVTIRPEQALVRGQIMVTGGAGDIEQVIERLPDDLELRRLVTTSFTFLREFPPPDGEQPDIRQQSPGKRQRAVDPLAGRLQDLPSLQMVLFEFPEATYPMSETLRLIADVVVDPDVALDIGVVAEPNYVTGFEITGSPWGVEGSPWGVEGSPWGVEGSPGQDADPSPGATYASDEFWMQWALRESPGINLFNGNAPLEGRTIVEQNGEGVQVAVFDTSPFETEGEYRFRGWGPEGIDPLTVTVSHPLTLPESDVTESDEVTETVDISDHGLFVSGLVYAVAPGSNIQLIRVLNDQGQGEVQALVDALNVYMRERLPPSGTLENTVINLSLGTHVPDDAELPPQAREQVERMLIEWGYPVPVGGRLPVLALEAITRIADMYGASVVAASGNHSAEEAQPLPPQLPAAYDTVIGVTASNHEEQPAQSCYANDGDLAAPGGDGGNGDENGDGVADEPPEGEDGAICLPTHMTCAADGANCDFGVVSYALKETTGFAYWVGTSFATPLVSGVAANVVHSGVNRPADVRDLLLCSAEGTGVVDVVEALNRCLTSR